MRASDITEDIQIADDLFEMANLDKSDTGIDGIVYVSTPEGSHAPRVKWYPGRPGRRVPCLSVTISTTPEARNHNLPKATADRMGPLVSQWVILNHAALMAFWQQGTSWTRQEVNAHFDQLRKLGT
jgi:hypothetical protein